MDDRFNFIMERPLKIQRLQIYREMLEMAKEDLKLSSEIKGLHLVGLCTLGKRAFRRADCVMPYERHLRIALPELFKYRPEGKNEMVHWWPTDPDEGRNTKRIEVLEEIIANLKNK